MDDAFRPAIRTLLISLASACILASVSLAGCAGRQAPSASLERSRVVLAPTGEGAATATANVAE